MGQLPYEVGLVDIDKAIFNNSFEGLYANRIFSHYLLHNASVLFHLQTYANYLEFAIPECFFLLRLDEYPYYFGYPAMADDHKALTLQMADMIHERPKVSKDFLTQIVKILR